MFSAFSAAVAAEGCTSLIKFDKEILYCSFIREVITHYPADWARKLNSRFFPRPIWKHFRDQTFQKRYRNLCFEKYPETETKLSETETETKFSETSKNWKKWRNQEVSSETEMSHFVVETWLKWPWQKKMPIHEWLAVLVMFFSDSIITAWRHINVFLIPFFIWFENGYTIAEWQFIGTVFNVGLMIGFKYWWP